MLVLNYIPMFFCVSRKFDVDSFSDVFYRLTENTVIHELDSLFSNDFSCSSFLCVEIYVLFEL